MTTDTNTVIDAVRAVAADVIAPKAAAVDREREFPAEAMQALAEVGALGLLVAPELGGRGAGLDELVQACEAVGSACASSAMVYLMHVVTCATIAGGGGELAQDYLGDLASGARLGTLAFSERGTGAHFYAPELTAVASDGGVRVAGRKSFVTSGGHADLYLVLVRSGQEQGLDCFAVERDAPGVRFDGSWDGLGMAGNSSIGMELQDVQVRADAQIGAAGGAGELVFTVVAPHFLVGLAAVNVGIAAAALAGATTHAVQRRYGDGSLLAEVQSIQHQLADMDIAVRSARQVVTDAARRGERGDPDALVAIMGAKVHATDTAAAVTQQALEVCGGQGYTRALPIERNLRDARAGAVMAPTNGVLRSWIGKAIAGLPVP